jgi:predicted esterase
VQRWSQQFAAGAFTTRAGVSVPYRYVRPAVAGRVPLVVILHGSEAMGTDNRSQLGPFAAAWAQPGIPPAMIVVPQVAERSAVYRTDRDGLLASMPGPSFPALFELIDALRGDPSVDPRRIHLVGFSMGASAALQLALARPGQFASITAFSPVPPEQAAAARLAHQPLTLVHGDADTENPFTADAAWVDALQRAGGQPRFIVYRGMDHRVPPDMITAADWRAALLAPQN